MGVSNLTNSIKMLKEDFRKRLRSYGLSETKIEETSRFFEQNNNHYDVISFVIMLERFGLLRRDIRDFLKDIGLDDTILINIFGKVDITQSGVSGADLTQVILED